MGAKSTGGRAETPLGGLVGRGEVDGVEGGSGWAELDGELRELAAGRQRGRLIQLC